MSLARILVVDDKENMRKLFGRFLGELYTVIAAEDGQEALRLLEKNHFDVVISDVRMPVADGFDVLRGVKEHSPRTEVILVTGHASIAAAVEAMRHGAYDYLQKPFDPDDVALVVARAVAKSRTGLGGLERPAPGTTEACIEPTAALPYREVVERAREQASRDYLAALLRHFRGNVTRAAQHAAIERESLHRLLRRHGIRSEEFKTEAADKDDGEPE